MTTTARIRRAPVLAGLLAAGALAALAVPAAATAAPSAALPRVTGVMAPSVSTTGGDTVTVSGQHFRNVSAVTFGGTAGTHVHVVSATKLTVTVPEHLISEVNVRVRTPGGLSPRNPHAVVDYQLRHELAAGYSHTCQVGGDHSVRCWGFNDHGQLGNAGTVNSSTPVRVGGINRAVAVAAGSYNSCALTIGGKVFCWGGNFDGQLGNGTTTDSSTPVQVLGLGRALSISAGAYHSCAIVVSNGGTKVQCWGDNYYGQLGNGTTTDATVATTVQHLKSVVDVDGGHGFACATRSTGTEFCWGDNSYRQLGDGTVTASTTPVQVLALKHAVATSSGGYSTCIINNTGGVFCFGYNGFGELGNGTTISSSHPVGVGLSAVSSIAVGGYQACAVRNGQAFCWGYNDYGQLGNGSNTNSTTPTAVSGLHHVSELTAGDYHSAATHPNGSTFAWGYNGYGELGDGTTTNSNTPVQVG